jgi:DNA polymerase sigma
LSSTNLAQKHKHCLATPQHQLVQELFEDEVKFKDFFRLKGEQFYYLLQKISSRRRKPLIASALNKDWQYL